MSDSKHRSPRDRKPNDDRKKFAAAIARSEFGRFYWSGEQASRLEEAMRKPKPARAGKDKKRI